MSVTQPPAGGRLAATSALTATTLFWALHYVIGALAVQSLDPFSLAFLRWALAAVLLLAIAQLAERPDWRLVLPRIPRLALLGTLGMLGFALFLYLGLRSTTPVSASLVGSVGPVLIAVAAALLLRERPGWRRWLGLAVALAGVLLVISRGSVEAVIGLRFDGGDLWIVAGTVCFAAYTVLSRRPDGVPPLTSTAVQASASAVILGVVVAFTGLRLPEDGPTWGALAFIVVFPSVGSYILWNFGLRRLPAAAAGIFLNLIAVFTVLIEVVIGGAVTLAEAIGGLVVLAGVLLATLPGRQRDAAAD